jgi:cell division protease FtsH
MTSGAANDIQKVTQVVRAMVIDFGMSHLGPINLGPQIEMSEFGTPDWYEPAQISEAMQEKVDLEVKKIVDSCYEKALALVRKSRKTLDKIVEKLLDKETIDREEFETIVGKKSSPSKGN